MNKAFNIQVHTPSLVLIKLFIVLIIVSNSLLLQAQKNYKSFSSIGSENSTGVEKLTVLYNQLYAYGYGGNAIKFEYNKPEFNVGGPRKLFLVKYNDTGAYSKTVSFGGNANNLNGGLCTLPNNYLCAAGVFSAGFYEGTKRVSNNSKGLFIVALDSSFVFKWRLIFSANKYFNCNLLCPDGKGNFFAAGYYNDSINIGAKKYIATNYKDSLDFKKDIFILHINQNGVVLKSFTMGSYGNDYPTALTCDEDGNVIVGANISDTVMLGDMLYQQQSKSKAVLFKMSPNGNTFWITGLAGAGVNIGSLALNSKYEIICGASFNGGLIVKYKNTSQKLTTDGLTYQILIGAFDASGKLLRSKTEGSENPTKLKAMCINKNDRIFISGTFQCTFTSYNLQNESFSFKNIGYDDIFLSAYDISLNPIWQRHAGGPRVDNLTDLVSWQNKPTISGDFLQYFCFNSDSIYPLYNAHYGYNAQRNYINNKYPGPYFHNAYSETAGSIIKAGFITNVIDESSPQLNYYFQTNLSSNPKFTEQAAWNNDLYNQSDTFCYKTGIRARWVNDGNPIGDNGGRDNGPFVDYLLNGVKTSWRDIKYESIITKSGNFTLEMKTIDGCYSQTIQKYYTILTEERATIGYDVSKIVNGYLKLCNSESTTFTATKTFGLKYFWVVDYYDYKLDTGNYYDTTNKLVYTLIKRDTFYTKDVVVDKSAQVYFVLEKNNNCKTSPYPITVRKLKFENTDSLMVDFSDSIDTVCTSSSSISKSFIVNIMDKKTLMMRRVVVYVDYKINGVASGLQGYYTSQNIQFGINKTGWYKIEGTIDMGCNKRSFSIQRYFTFLNPKITITGKLSKCRDEEQIFEADSGYIKYFWYASGTPVIPVITYLSPRKIKVKGSVNYIYVTGYSDTTPEKQCAASAEKRIYVNTSNLIKSNTNPPILCPGKKITLNVENGSNYFWYPNGETTKTITTDIPGIYYCSYLDTAGCTIKSASIELIESFKPDLLIQPDDGVCPGQNAEIFVTVPKSSTITWIQPTSFGNTSHIITKVTGIVKCSTNVCNTPYILQANIAFKKFSQSTKYHSSNYCIGQTINIQSHDSETYAYKWSLLSNVVLKDSQIISYTSGTELSDQRIYSAKKDGIYLVEAKDVCDNWYKSDFYFLKKSNRAGINKNYYKAICGNNSFLFDLRNSSNPPLDSFNKCIWFHDNDTAFKKSFLSVKREYLAIITNKFCSSPDTLYLKVTNRTVPTIKLSAKTEVCKGDTINVTAKLSDNTWSDSLIQWNLGLGFGNEKTVTVLAQTIYKSSITDSCGTNSDSIIVIPQIVSAKFITDYNDSLDKTFLMDKSLGKNINNWQWLLDNIYLSDFQNAEILNPSKSSYVVCLFIQNEISCKDSVCKTVPIPSKGNIYIPDIFNPSSGIPINKLFAPFGRMALQYQMQIYSRWGEKLFIGGTDTGGWDGNYQGAPCQDGNYIYIITAKFNDLNGNPITRNFKGTLLLLR